MLHEIIIGIDNGISGSIGIIDCMTGYTDFIEVPAKSEQNYTKAKKILLELIMINYKFI